MKKIFISSLISAIMLMFGQIALADNAILSALPASASSTVGAQFNISVQINPANSKVCVVKGAVNINDMICKNITLADGVMAQTVPTCSATSFVIGIPKCATVPQNLFSVSVLGNQTGQANLSFTGIKVIGVGMDVPFSSAGSSYSITAVAQKTTQGPTTETTSTATKTTEKKETTTENNKNAEVSSTTNENISTTSATSGTTTVASANSGLFAAAMEGFINVSTAPIMILIVIVIIIAVSSFFFM